MEKPTVQKLSFKDFEDIEIDPNGFKIDYLAAIAKRAMDILDREEQTKNKDEGKRKFFELNLDHPDQQDDKKKKKKKKKLEETLDKPRFSKGICIKEVSEMVISREDKQCSEIVGRTSNQDEEKEDSRLSHEKRLRREKLLKRPMVEVKKASTDNEFQEVKKIKRKKYNIKKSNISHSGDPPPELPREFMEILESFARDVPIKELQLVIQKRLFVTDVGRGHNRLSLPKRHVAEFLTEDEVAKLKLRVGKNVNPIKVDLIEPCLRRSKVSLRRWEMKKEKGNSSITYVLTGSWNDVVDRNSLREGQLVQVWSARLRGKLWFLLVRIPNGRGQNLTTANVSQPPPGNENDAPAGAGPSVLPSDESGPSSSSSLEPLDPSNKPGLSSSSGSEPDQDLHESN